MSDYSIRPWRPEDRPQLKALWQLAFGDSDDYIELFFEKFLKRDACVVAQADGKVVSAMYILLGENVYPFRKNVLAAGYTYALATLPEYRGRGIGAAVYRAACDAALKTADAACVLPAEESLYSFYEKASCAKPFSYAREARFTRAELQAAEGCMAARVPALKYAGMRENLLGGMPHATFSPEVFDLLEETGCDFFVLANGLAAAQTEDGVCHVLELLDPNTDGMSSLAALASWCPAEEYVVRTPLFFGGPGQARPFMLASLKETPGYPLPSDLWWGFGLD